MIIVGFIILIVLAVIYIGLPLWAKVIIFGINSFFPDPIPVVDEVLMMLAILNEITRIFRIMVIIEWVQVHKRLLLTIGIVIILLIVAALILQK